MCDGIQPAVFVHALALSMSSTPALDVLISVSGQRIFSVSCFPCEDRPSSGLIVGLHSIAWCRFVWFNSPRVLAYRPGASLAWIAVPCPPSTNPPKDAPKNSPKKRYRLSKAVEVQIRQKPQNQSQKSVEREGSPRSPAVARSSM